MSMRPDDLLKTVRHAFATNRLRAVLTLTGIVIGAGSIVMLASLLEAGQDALVRTSQNANESDMIEVYQRRAPHQDRFKTTRPLTAYDGDALQESPLLEGARVTTAPQRRTTARVGSKEKPVTLFGAGTDALSLYRLEVERGRSLVEDDLVKLRGVAVVGQEVWTELLDKEQDLSKLRVTVDGESFAVVGVLAHKPVLGGGSGTWMWDRRVMVPRTTFLATLETGRKVRSVFVRLKDAGPVAERIARVADVVESTLLRRHHGVKNFRRQGDGEENQEELILAIVKILLLGTGVVALFVGGTNIMNIMLVTVAERTREIGIRLAVGARRRHILWQFLLEAMALSLVGGVIGVVAGLGTAWLISVALTQVLGHWPFLILWWSVVLGVVLALVVGAVFGLLPAWRAARLDPVVALRSE